MSDFYCDEVLNGKTPVDVVFETETVLAFHHTRPSYPTHIVVIPKRHIPSLLHLTSDDAPLIVEMMQVIQQIAAGVVTATGACKVITNLGEDQDSQHIHWHLISKENSRLQYIEQTEQAETGRITMTQTSTHTDEHLSTQTGLQHLEQMFQAANEQGRPAFMPFFPIGYPTYDESLALIEMMAASGVDGFEIGIPFSDPLADGPVIQAASQIALDNGMTVRKALEGVRELRSRGVHQPMLMFSYANPLVAYGPERFVLDAKAAGADGLIIPDLPPEEARLFADFCQREGLALVLLLAPTSNEGRIRLVGEHATGFIYIVSVVGITGTRTELPADLIDFIRGVREKVSQPLVLGFGISRPEHVRQISESVNGFIVGSALVRAAGQRAEAVKTLTVTLRHALDA